MKESATMLEVLKREAENVKKKLNETGKLWIACQRCQEELTSEIEEARRHVQELEKTLEETNAEEVEYRKQYARLLGAQEDIQKKIDKF